MQFRFRRFHFAAVVVGLAFSTLSSAIFLGPPPVYAVSEYVNDATGHYALLPYDYGIFDPADGGLGNGWHRTGFTFATSPGATPVCHFRLPSIGGHFYTADARECEIVKNSPGWVYDDIPFFVKVPSAGACLPGDVAIHGLYNNRESKGDPGHRWTNDAAAIADLVSKGWTDYGPVFCSANAGPAPDLTWPVAPSTYMTTAAQCTGGCTVLESLASLANRIPRFLPLSAQPNPAFPLDAYRVLGVTSGTDLFTAEPAGSSAIAQHTFILETGLFLNGADRTAGDYASISPTVVQPTTFPEWSVYPWRASTRRSLVVRADFTVATIARATPSAHAYGHPKIRWIDSRSGASFLMTLQTFGTLPSGDFNGKQVGTGEAIVSTAFGPTPGFGTRLSGDYVQCDASPCKPDRGAPFAFRIGYADMVEALARARSVDPRLSADPRDYSVGAFMFHVETFLDAQVGMSLYSAAMEVWP